MRRELLAITLVASAAFVIRVLPAWDAVFGGPRVRFLETDAWYHVRLIEHQVRNFPWRLTLDPYAAPGGQFVPIAPLYDFISSAAVVLVHGRHASTNAVERVAAFVPPVLGALAVVIVWALARRAFDWRAGLLAAGLLAILPGHFLDRTTLGFVDHHALEALLALVILFAIVRALQESDLLEHRAWLRQAPMIGLALGLYLLTWASGAFLVAILGGWLVIMAVLVPSPQALRVAARAMAAAAVVALVIVAAFQDPAIHRYGTQVLGLVGLALIASVLQIVGGRARAHYRVAAAGAVVMLVVGGGFAVWLFDATLFHQILVDLGRLTPDPARMSVLEARPLFKYPGSSNWLQPWQFFRTGFYVGAAGLMLLAVRAWRSRQPVDLLIGVFAAATFVATIGQNRFGYYLVPACALVGGWLASAALAWGERVRPAHSSAPGRRTFPLVREAASLALVGAMIGPNLAPSTLLRPRTSTLDAYWEDTMAWLRDHTPEPFANVTPAGADYYLARYPRERVPLPGFTVMSWWDQGYWIIERARRVPVANPTQERASIAARFYVETDEGHAARLLRRERTALVVADFELPFRMTPERSIMGRFQNIVQWAGAREADYYEVYYRRVDGEWRPVWIFHEPYYRSMAYRLSVLGGAAATPRNATTVMTFTTRRDDTAGEFHEILTERTFESIEAAREAALTIGQPNTVIVGLDPWRAAFPVEPMTSMVQVYGARTAEQRPSEAPWVRIFQVRAAPSRSRRRRTTPSDHL